MRFIDTHLPRVKLLMYSRIWWDMESMIGFRPFLLASLEHFRIALWLKVMTDYCTLLERLFIPELDKRTWLKERLFEPG